MRLESLGIVAIAFVAVLAVRALVQRRSEGSNLTEVELIPVAGPDDLAALFDQSTTEKSLLFLHDPFCPTSARAARQITAFGKPVHLINVSTQPELTEEVEQRTGIKHESPQAFVFSNGRPFWFASHGRITSAGLNEAWETPDTRPLPESAESD
jgi:bacillithiol system protein YtxJ